MEKITDSFNKIVIQFHVLDLAHGRHPMMIQRFKLLKQRLMRVTDILTQLPFTAMKSVLVKVSKHLESIEKHYLLQANYGIL